MRQRETERDREKEREKEKEEKERAREKERERVRQRDTERERERRRERKRKRKRKRESEREIGGQMDFDKLMQDVPVPVVPVPWVIVGHIETLEVLTGRKHFFRRNRCGKEVWQVFVI